MLVVFHKNLNPNYPVDSSSVQAHIVCLSPTWHDIPLLVAWQEDSRTTTTFPPFTTDTAKIDQQVPSKVSIFSGPDRNTWAYLRDARVDVPLDFHRIFFPISCEAFSPDLRCSISDTMNSSQKERKKRKATPKFTHLSMHSERRGSGSDAVGRAGSHMEGHRVALGPRSHGPCVPPTKRCPDPRVGHT
jgi:hypothetical protein